jgi:hypothetical protein
MVVVVLRRRARINCGPAMTKTQRRRDTPPVISPGLSQLRSGSFRCDPAADTPDTPVYSLRSGATAGRNAGKNMLVLLSVEIVALGSIGFITLGLVRR